MSDGKHELKDGEAATILHWWRSHPVAAENAAKSGKCPDILKPLGPAKVVHHLRELSTWKASQKKRKKRPRP